MTAQALAACTSHACLAVGTWLSCAPVHAFTAAPGGTSRIRAGVAAESLPVMHLARHSDRINTAPAPAGTDSMTSTGTDTIGLHKSGAALIRKYYL